MIYPASLKTFDPAEHIETPEAVAVYLQDIFATSDPELIASALGDVARSKGMSEIAKRAGLPNEALNAALSCEELRLSTMISVVKSAGLELRASQGRRAKTRMRRPLHWRAASSRSACGSFSRARTSSIF